MPWYADLHIHSKFSRATSGESDLEHLALWAGKKGIRVLGTGDFTHPAWRAEIQDKLEPAGPGLFGLRHDLAKEVERRLEPACRGPVQFMLTVEISTIYKKNDRTRKVHHLICVPDLAAADRLTKSLAKIGNLKSDGRPILGLDSRDLLEITLESGEGSYLIPAHIWTPWFSMLGSKSGFDSIEECYADLSSHIFALETGLSSDPPMNWRLSMLDCCRLVSNSDAHSPAKLGREANVFDIEPDYFALQNALQTGEGYQGTVEFFPEEGKYHLDGHRKCGVRLDPAETRKRKGRCPVCGKPVTVGVMSRVEELSDRTDGARPPSAGPFRSLIPLSEVIAEILGCGAATKGVSKTYESLITRLGPELFILEHAPFEDVRRIGSETLAEALQRMREGRVIREAGYDGDYGVIKLFAKGELKSGSASAGLLFELPQEETLPRADIAGRDEQREAENGDEERPEPVKKTGKKPKAAKPEAGPGIAKERSTLARKKDILAGLDPDQRQAAEIIHGPLLIIAGPGTGKTRTLTHRVARLISVHHVTPGRCLAITFTRRAAAEMKERLAALLPATGEEVPVMTFHGLGLSILQEHGARLGLPRHLRIATEAERAELLKEGLNIKGRKAGKLLGEISRLKRTESAGEPGSDLARAFELYGERMKARAMVDYDDLIGRSVELLESDPGMLALYRERYQYISIDEYQDIDEMQYRLVKLLAPAEGNICVIGDPDQAIYGFRGADVRFFLRFQEDFPEARTVTLMKNYRSSRAILDASLQVISPASLVAQRIMEALLDDPARIVIHEAATDKAEAEFIVHTIERMIGGSGFFSMDSGRVESAEEAGDYSFSDFAVLYRTDAQAGLLVEALARSGIPFQKRSHSRLSEQPGVEKIMDLMRGDAGDGPVTEMLKQAAEQAKEDESVMAALEILSPLAGQCGRDREKFLAAIGLDAEVDVWDPRADRVSLLTLHAAKGLEFRAVFIAGCEEGLIPLKWSVDEQGGLDEERRLFFVGMTRAKERLFLSYAHRRLLQGKARKTGPSPFLTDIKEQLLERTKSRAGKKKPGPSTEQLDLF